MADSDINNVPNFGEINSNKLKQLNNFIIQDFYESFENFIQYFTANSKHSTCSVAWNDLSIACSCRDCQVSSNNCTCIKCFLEGPHKHHHCKIHLSSSGNCDCGDFSGWKPSGTCKCHRSIYNNLSTENNNDDDYFVSKIEKIPDCSLPVEIKRRLLIAFNEIKNDIFKMIETGNFQYFTNCCNWYFQFSQAGDEIRNCIIETLADQNFLTKIISNSKNMNREKMNSFFYLTGTITNSYQFISIFMESIVQVLPDLLQTIRRGSTAPFFVYNDIPFIGISVVINYCYQYINNCSVRILTEQNKFDWIGFILMINEVFCDFIISEENYNSLVNFDLVFKILESYKFVLRTIFKMKSESHKMKNFFIKFAKSCEKIEGFCHHEFHNDSQCLDVYFLLIRLYKFPHMLAKNIQYFVPEIFDIFIHHLLNDNEFKERRKNVCNYSMSTLLHQLFIHDLLIFGRNNQCEKEVINDDDFFNVCYIGKDPKDTFDYYCQLNLKRKGINDINIELINDIYLNAIELPMISIAFNYLIDFSTIELNVPNRIRTAIKNYHINKTFKIYILPRMISIVQTMFSFSSKERKNKMIEIISNYFGAFKSDYDVGNQKMRDFSYLMFICTLILDRNCINEESISICLKNLMSQMKYEKLNIENIESMISPFQLTNAKFLEKYNKMNIDFDWDLILPCCNSINYLYSNIIPSIIGKTQDLLLPFPEFHENSIFLSNLNEVFECKFIFASIFYLIYEYNNEKVMMQYALNLFITFAQNSKHIENDDSLMNEIHARNVNELSCKIPTTNFRLFSKIKVCFKGNTGISLIQLVDDLGPIGLTTLRQAGLSEKVNDKPKKEILDMKNQIIRKFNKKRQKFMSTIDRQSHNCCSICHKTFSPYLNNHSMIDILKSNKDNFILDTNSEKPKKNIFNSKNELYKKLLFIPISFFGSVSMNLIEDLINGEYDKNKKYENETYVRPLLGNKYMHFQCFENEKFFGQAMLKIDSLFEDYGILENSNAYLSIIDKIILSLAINSLYNKGIPLLSRMISVLDLRSRLRPEILDDSNTFIFYVNLFKNCTFLSNFLKNNLILDLLNSIERVIYECILYYSPFEDTNSESVDDKNEYEEVLKIRENEKLENISFNQFLFSKIVQRHGCLNEKHQEYLRRCFLIEKFYIAEKNEIDESFIDWDFSLNYKNLYSHFYHKKLTNEKTDELKVFRGIKLPKYFLEFIYPPYNVSFLSITDGSELYLCLLTGEIFKGQYRYNAVSKSPFNINITLNLHGTEISSIIFSSGSMISRKIRSIYVDENGIEDVGFRRGKNLTLSQERYNKLIDAYLSGDIFDDSFF